MEVATGIQIMNKAGGNRDRVVAVEAGRYVSGAITARGDLYTWGKDSLLGYPVMIGGGGDERTGTGKEKKTTSTQLVPRRVSSLKQVVQISFGFDHAGACTSNGRLYTWGEGKFSQLGHGNTDSRCKPTQVDFLASVPVSSVAAGTRFTLCTAEDGTVYSWGAGAMGQLGHPQKKRQALPKIVKGLEKANVVQISCGESHALALSEAGTLYGWGSSENGCNGDGKMDGFCLLPKVVDFNGTKVVRIASGPEHNAAIDEFGSLHTWGRGHDGRLGHAIKADVDYVGVPRPKKVTAKILSLAGGAVAIACGTKHTACTTKAVGTILIWGCVHDGRLGQGTQNKMNVNEPSLLNFDPMTEGKSATLNFSFVSCGENHSLAVTSEGGLYAWGATDSTWNFGQLGPKLGGSLASKLSSPNTSEGVKKKAESTPLPEEVDEDSDSSGVGMMSPRHILRPKQLESVKGAGGADPHPSLHSPASREDHHRAKFHEDAEDDSDSDSSGLGAFGETLSVGIVKRPEGLTSPGDGVDPHPSLSTPASRLEGGSFGFDDGEGNYDNSSSIGVLKKALKDLQRKHAMAELGRRVGSLVRILSKQHTVVLASAMHHWRVTSIVESISGVVVGEVSRIRGSQREIAPRLLRSVFQSMYTTQCRRAFTKLQYNWMVGKALEKTIDTRKELVRKLDVMTKEQERSKHRLHYNREILRDRLLKTSIRYGRDKVCAVLHARSAHNVRESFSRWRLHSQAKQRADALRRGRLKLRVNMDQIELERESFAQGRLELEQSKKMFGVFVAFHKWRQRRDQQVQADAIKRIKKDRDDLKRELLVLLQHMDDLKEAEETTRRTSAQRGHAMIGEITDQMKILTTASQKRRLRIDAWINK